MNGNKKERVLQRLNTRLTPLVLAMASIMPMSVEAAITVDEREKRTPSVLGSANGTPTIDINNANDKGVSHNKYQDFNVGHEGVIFNNSTHDGVSKIGGYVMKNNHLQNEASVILNEVTGAKGSYLNGTIEVFGRNADLILANENGISVNGVSTINANNLTLSTGRVNLDQNGNIKLAVEQGNVSLEGTGINTAGLSYFDIISRTATLKGEIAGSADIKVLTGLNDYNATTRTHSIRSKVNDSTSQIAIDGSQLGSMYGNRIQLISTESGAGVFHQGSIAGNNGIEISSEGDIRLSNLSANSNNVSITGRSIALNNNSITGIGGIGADGDIIISALNQISLNVDTISEKGAIRINAGSLLQSAATLLARNTSRTRGAISSIEINVNDRYSISGDLYAVDAKNGKKIDNAQVKLLAGKYVVIASGRIIDNATVMSDATLTANSGDLVINVGTLENESGIIVSNNGTLVFHLKDAMLNNGLVQANGSIELKGRRLKNSGVFNTTADTLLTLGKIENSGSIYANNITVATNEFDNQGVVLAENGQLSLQVTGKMDTLNKGLLQGKNTSIKTDGTLVNHGNIAAQSLMTIDVDKLSNHHHLTANDKISLEINSELENSGNNALISANEGLSIAGKGNENALTIDNNQGGRLQSQHGNIDIRDVKSVVNQMGSVLANKNLLLTNSQSVTNNNGKLQGENVTINNVKRLKNNGGDAVIVASRQLHLADVDHIENNAGSITSIDTFTLERVHSLFNISGELAASNDISISNVNNFRNVDAAKVYSLYGGAFLDTITNMSNLSASVMQAQGPFSFENIKEFDNAESAIIQSLDGLTVNNITTLINAGQILSNAELVITNINKLVNNGELAIIQAVDIILSGMSSVNNKNGAAIVAKESLNITKIASLLNETLSFLQGNNVEINSDTITNRGYGTEIIANNSLNVSSVEINNSEEATIFSDNNLPIKADKLSNSTYSEIAGGRFTINADSLLNNGLILAQSDSGNSVINSKSFDNRTGVTRSFADLFIRTPFFANQNGSLFGRKSLNIYLENDFTNEHNGLLMSPQKLSIESSGNITIDQALESYGSVFLTGNNIYNNSHIVSADDIYLTAINIINNTNSLIYSMKDTVINAGETLLNKIKGNILSQKDITVIAKKIHNQAGIIRSEADIYLDAGLILNESQHRNETWDYGPYETGSHIVEYPELGYNEKYGVTFYLPRIHSNLTLETWAEISSGGNLFINKNNTHNGVLNNEGGLIQAKGDLLVNGEVNNTPKYISASWLDYLKYNFVPGCEIKLTFEEYNIVEEFHATLKFNDMFSLLNYLYGTGTPSSVTGLVSKTKNHAANNFTNAIKHLANQHYMLNKVMNTLFGELWQASSFKQLSARWTELTNNDSKLLKDKKSYLLSGDKATIISGGDFTHNGGSFSNGIDPAIVAGSDVKKNAIVNVSVGDQTVTTIEENYSVTTNTKSISEIMMGISTLPTLSDLVAIRGLFEKSQGFINGNNAHVNSASGPVNNIIQMYETRPSMIDQSQYYGSGYFFSRVNYTPEKPITVIGDNYFITEMIRRQLNNSVGSYFSVKYNVDGADLVKMLFDNVAEVITSNVGESFVVGEPLSKAQQESLQQDIIWFVTEYVDGAEALVPRIYLASATIREIKLANDTGAAIVHAGGNVKIDAESADNINAILSAGNNITIVSDYDINNISNGMNAGINVGGSIDFSSKSGDITNQGSGLKSNQHISLTAEKGSVDIMASVGRNEDGALKIGAYEDGLTAGGDVRIKSKDITLTGVAITGGNSNDSEIHLTATEGNVNFNDVHEVYSSYEQSSERANWLNSRVMESTGASATSVTNTMSGGGKFIVDAAKDAIFTGGDYNALSAEISAGGDVVTKTSQDHEYSNTTVTETSFQVGVTSNVPGLEATHDGYSGLDGTYSSLHDEYTSGGSQSLTDSVHGRRAGAAPLASSGSFYAGVQQKTTSASESSITNNNGNFNFTNGSDIHAGKTLDIGGMDLTVGELATANFSGANVISTKYQDVKKVTTESTESFAGIKGTAQSTILDAANKYANTASDNYNGKEIDAARTTGQVAGDISNLVFNDTASGSLSFGWSQDKESSSATKKNDNINSITGGKINISSNQNTTLKGVDISAPVVMIDAAGNFSLSSAERHSNQSFSTESHNAGVSLGGGLTFLGSGVGASLDYSGSTSNSTIASTSQTNSTINAGQLTVKVGNDMNIAGGNIVADKADLKVSGDLNIISVQDSYQENGDRTNYGGSLGVSVSTNGILPSVSAHGGGGSESHDINLTAQQSGIQTANEVNVMTGGDMNLVGGHIISDNQTGSVDVAGSIHASDLLDNKDESGMYQGGGGGISKNGTLTANYYNDTNDEVHYKELQHSTINVGTANSRVDGQLISDAEQFSTVTENRVIAGNNISATASGSLSKGKNRGNNSGSNDTVDGPQPSRPGGQADSSSTAHPGGIASTGGSSSQTPGSSAQPPASSTARPDANGKWPTVTAPSGFVGGTGSASRPSGPTTPGATPSVNQGAGQPKSSPGGSAQPPASSTAMPDANGKWPTVTAPSGFVGGTGSASRPSGPTTPGSTPSVNQGAGQPKSPPGSSAQLPASSTASPAANGKWPTVTPPSSYVGGTGSASRPSGLNSGGSVKPAANSPQMSSQGNSWKNLVDNQSIQPPKNSNN